MTAYVEPLRTGRDGQRVSIRGEGRRTGQIVSPSVPSTDAASWTVTRFQVFAFALMDGYEVTERQGLLAACVSMPVLALESGYGEHEYRWNAVGMACAGAALCMRFPEGQGDPELRAYTDLAAAARDFWRVVKLRMTAEEWAWLLAGDFRAWMGMWRRGVWSAGSNDGDAMNSILTRVVRYLREGGIADADTEVRALPAGTDLGHVVGPRTTPGTTTRRRRGRGSLGKLLAVAAAIYAATRG